MNNRLTTPLSVLLSCCLLFGPVAPAFATDDAQAPLEEGLAEGAVVAEDVDNVDSGQEGEGEEATSVADASEDALAEDTGDDAVTDSDDAPATVEQVSEDDVVDDQQATSDEQFEPEVEAVEPEKTETEEQNQEVKKEDVEDDLALVAQSSVSDADAFAAKHKGVIANGTYAFTCTLGSGFAMDVRGASKANNVQVISWSTKNASNQRWLVENVGGGYVTIKCVNSGKYLQAGQGGKAYRVVQNARSSSNRGQLWIACRESGAYKFVSALDLNRVLVVSGGTKAKSGYAIYSYLEKSAVTANKLWNVTVTKDIQDAFAKAHKGDLADGVYFVASSASSSLRLSIAGASLEDSAQANLQASATKTIQGWKVSHDGVGYVTLVNVQSGRALDVRGSKAAEGNAIIQYTRNTAGVRNQKWIAVKGSNGSYTFYSALTGAKLVLGTSGAGASAAARLCASTGAAVQQWNASKAPSHFAHLGDVPNGEYLIETNLDKSKVLDVAGSSKKSGVGVKLWSSKLAPNQVWKLSHDDAGYVHLTNKNSNLQLGYAGGRLVQSSSAFKWVFEKVSGGYHIVAATSGKCLDVSRNNTDNKTNKVILYTKGSGKNQVWSVASPVIGSNTTIMGVSQVTQAQAVRYIKNTYRSRGQSLPKKWITDGETVEKIVKYFWEEGADEGVRGDVALAQSIHETGMFQFGGDVIPAQYNFAGIGTTGGGVKGNYFKNARVGVRAQIQHLKAYASTKPLNKACVDPRFNLVSRGCAPTIAGLANTWAIDATYAKSITHYLNSMNTAL